MPFLRKKVPKLFGEYLKNHYFCKRNQGHNHGYRVHRYRKQKAPEWLQLFRGGAKAKALARSQRNGAKLGLFHETAKFGGVENSENSRIYRITLYIGAL